MVGFSSEYDCLEHLPPKKRFRLLDCSHILKEGEGEEEEYSNIPNLSEDIIFNILCWGSADFLHNVGRSVCKCWGTIISTRRFVDAHLYHSVQTFISDNSLDDSNEVRQFELRDGLFRSQRILEIPTGFIMDSCLGLLLLHVSSRLHLINPVMKQHLKLPYGPPSYTRLQSAKIAYITHSNEIKVICRYDSKISHSHLWGILTVGNNMSWKIFNDPSLQEIPEPEYLQTPISIGGVVIYWSWGERSSFKDRFYAIDVDDESVKTVHVPLQVIEDGYKTLITKGRDLYLISGFWREIVILKLKDSGRSEWVEVFRSKDVYLEPFRTNVICYHVWLENDKILIYSKKEKYCDEFTRIMAYDFISRRVFPLQISCSPHLLNFMRHTASLISF